MAEINAETLALFAQAEAQRAEAESKLGAELLSEPAGDSPTPNTTDTTDSTIITILRSEPAVISALRRIDSSPGSVVGYAALAAEHEKAARSGRTDLAGAVLSALVHWFPSHPTFAEAIVMTELSAGRLDNARQALRRGLQRCPASPSLWHRYVRYVRVVNGFPDEASTTALTILRSLEAKEAAAPVSERADLARARRDRVAAGFAYALDCAGSSLDASALYRAAIAFHLDLPKDAQPFAVRDAQEKARQVYHRAVATPLRDLEKVWAEYVAFEQAIPDNQPMASKNIRSISPRYMTARGVAHRIRAAFAKIFDAERAVMAVREGANIPTYFAMEPIGFPQELALAEAWQSYLALEGENPCNVEPDVWVARMRYAHNAAVSSLYRHPAAWLEFAAFEHSHGDLESARAVCERAIAACPREALVYLGAGEAAVRAGDADRATSLCEELVAAARDSSSLIAAMRAARSWVGAQAFRNIFKLARHSPHCTWHVYADAARLELTTSGSSEGGASATVVVRNIFLMGKRKHPRDVGLRLDMASCLAKELRDPSNAQSELEQALVAFADDDDATLALLNALIDLYSSQADAAGLAEVQARRANRFPDLDPQSVAGLYARHCRNHFGLPPLSVEAQLVTPRVPDSVARPTGARAGGSIATTTADTATASSSPSSNTVESALSSLLGSPPPRLGARLARLPRLDPAQLLVYEPPPPSPSGPGPHPSYPPNINEIITRLGGARQQAPPEEPPVDAILDALARAKFDEATEAVAARAVAATSWNPLGKATPYDEYHASKALAADRAGSKRKAGGSGGARADEDVDVFTARRRLRV